MRKCRKCSAEKPIEEFGNDKYLPDGKTIDCKACRRIKSREYDLKRPEVRKKINDSYKAYRKEYYADVTRKKYYKDLELQRSFGISLDEYDKMVNSQNGVCAICGLPQESKRNKVLSVDHCHKTGIIRGLLCDKCNSGLGFFNDDPAILESAIKYLAKRRKNGKRVNGY